MCSAITDRSDPDHQPEQDVPLISADQNILPCQEMKRLIIQKTSISTVSALLLKIFDISDTVREISN